MKLDPPAPAPVILTGSAMRVTVNVGKLSLQGEQLLANVTVGSSPVSLGTLPTHGTVTLTGSLTGCPCQLQGFFLQPGGAVHRASGTGDRKPHYCGACRACQLRLDVCQVEPVDQHGGVEGGRSVQPA